VFAVRPVTVALTLDAVLPDPRLWLDVAVDPDKELLVPYWNKAVVLAPLGLTVPANVAEVVETVALPVVTVGTLVLEPPLPHP
jgi:hypothetical protein